MTSELARTLRAATACATLAFVSPALAQDFGSTVSAAMDAFREAKEKSAAPAEIQAIFARASEAEDDGVINFCGFYLGMPADDAIALAEHYRLKQNQWSLSSEPSTKHVYRLAFTLHGVRKVTKGGNTFEELSQAVANHIGSMKAKHDDDYNLIGYEYRNIDGQTALISERKGLELEDRHLASKAMSEAKTLAVHPTADKIQLWEGGPYWATRNIGAETPLEFGLYFWWGDTIGYKREGDIWVASDGSLSHFRFLDTPTKDKSPATLLSKGWVVSTDGTCVLAPEHDAAHVHWGGSWRMPTKQELDDLLNNCDWTWTTINGVNGYVVQGRGGSIFLPAAGYGLGFLLREAASNGRYWSSVPDSDSDDRSWHLCFFSDRHYVTDCPSRGIGLPIRPVQEIAAASAQTIEPKSSEFETTSKATGQSNTAEEIETLFNQAKLLVKMNKREEAIEKYRLIGNEIAAKMRSYMLDDQPGEAQKFLDDQMEILVKIHGALIEIENESDTRVVWQSPLPECRYLIATMQQERAQKIIKSQDWDINDPQKKEEVVSLLLGAKDSATGKRNGRGAYNHFINVFLRFPESSRAIDAFNHSEEVRTLLAETFGATLKYSATPEHMAMVQYYIGLHYEYGEGVGKDEAKAVEWFRKAAEQGNANAQYCLGLCYESGTGVEEDESRGVEWYMKAAEQDHREASKALMRLCDSHPELLDGVYGPQLKSFFAKFKEKGGEDEEKSGKGEDAQVKAVDDKTILDRVEEVNDCVQKGNSCDVFTKLASDMAPIPGKDYAMCKYEVTQALWETVMGSNLSHFKGANLPVESFSWDVCRQFIEKLNDRPEVKSSGRKYRLPTQEEWEYASLAGGDDKYPLAADGTYVSKRSVERIAWCDENCDGTTHPVGQKEANAFGLFDVMGNVAELMYDMTGRKGVDYNSIVYSGGSWVDSKDGFLVIDMPMAFASKWQTGDGQNYVGLRLACDVAR